MCYCTVEHACSKHAYNELKLIVKWFSFPLTVNIYWTLNRFITNYAYKEAKLSVPGTHYKLVLLYEVACLYSLYLFIVYYMHQHTIKQV